MTSFWTTLVLIFKNWKYVVQFIDIVEKAAVNGYNAYDLNRSLKRLEQGFKDAKTIKDSADSARSINDSFRK